MDLKNTATPSYIIEESLLRENLTTISKVAKEADIEIILAFKGFAMWGVFPIVREYIKGAAASSVHEARLAAEEMKTLAHTYSPAFTDREFDEIIQYSSHITFNSLAQFKRLYPRILSSGKKISVGMRVNPGYSKVKTDLYNPAAPGSRLGISPDELGETLPEGIEGFHFHTLFEDDSFTLEKTLEAFEERYAQYLPQLKWVNMGGGHLITGKDYDTHHLIKLLENFKKKHGVHIILEPGSAFAWQTGVLVASIVDLIENSGIKTAILDTSFTAHMPDCLEMPYKPVIRNASMDANAGGFPYRMGGNSCLAGDFMGDWWFKNPLQIGDKIIFEDMIHYTMVKTNTFNGVQHPSIAIWTKENKLKVIKEFNYFDYRNKLS